MCYPSSARNAFQLSMWFVSSLFNCKKSVLYLIDHEIRKLLTEGADPTLISDYSSKYIKALNVLRLKFMKRIGILIGAGSSISSPGTPVEAPKGFSPAAPVIKLRELMDEYLEANERGGAETSTRLHYWLDFLQVNISKCLMYREISFICGRLIYGRVLRSLRALNSSSVVIYSGKRGLRSLAKLLRIKTGCGRTLVRYTSYFSHLVQKVFLRWRT
jgi:hypothetical protein